MAASSPLENVLRRDRLIVITAFVTVIVACWAYVLDCAGMGMAMVEGNALTPAPGDTDCDMPRMAMAEGAADGTSDMAIGIMAPSAWTPGYAGLMFFKWWIMMMAMMLPSTAPVILMFAHPRHLVGEQRAHVGAGGVDERDRDHLAAQILEPHLLAVLRGQGEVGRLPDRWQPLLVGGLMRLD
jgi:predicted metal-binding membrane protein